MHLFERERVTILMTIRIRGQYFLMKQWLLYLTIHFLIVCVWTGRPKFASRW